MAGVPMPTMSTDIWHRGGRSSWIGASPVPTTPRLKWKVRVGPCLDGDGAPIAEIRTLQTSGSSLSRDLTLPEGLPVHRNLWHCRKPPFVHRLLGPGRPLAQSIGSCEELLGGGALQDRVGYGFDVLGIFQRLQGRRDPVGNGRPEFAGDEP